MKKDINYFDIKSFLVLVEAGSFTKAAEKLLCSRAHISKQLAQLENSLGVSLLVRTTRTQHLTASGEAFYKRCKLAFRDIDLAVDEVMESASMLSGEIKINSVGGYIGENIIGPLVTDFMQQHPDINVTLDFSSRRVDLVLGEFDFVFRMGELVDSALIARKLTELKIDTYASPSYLDTHNKPDSPKDLVNHKCITGTMRNWSFINSNTGSKTEITVNGDLTCKNGRIMLHSALAGNGIIRVPQIYCANEVSQGKLTPVFSDWHIESTPFYLIYLKDKHQPGRITAFKDFVTANFVTYLRAS